MTVEDVRRRLRYLIADMGGKQTSLAAELGCSDAYLSQVLSGKKPPSNAMLDAVGLERVTRVTYRRLRWHDDAEA